MKHVLKHDLTNANAKKVIEKAFGVYSANKEYAAHKLTLVWKDVTNAVLSFTVAGSKYDVIIKLLDKCIALEVNLGFFGTIAFKAISTQVDVFVLLEFELQMWTIRAGLL